MNSTETNQLTSHDAISVVLNYWVKHSKGRAHTQAMHARTQFLGGNLGLADSLFDNSFDGIYGFLGSILGLDPKSNIGDEYFFIAAELILQNDPDCDSRVSSPSDAIEDGDTHPHHGHRSHGKRHAA
jgi:hypothetical protein